VSRSALLAGATGLVGHHVLELVLANDTWSHVVTVGRRPSPLQHQKLEQRVVDLAGLDADPHLPRVDDVFCCLGTTIKQARTAAAFRRVDHDFVLALGRAGVRAGATQFLLVSAVGADRRSRMFYSRVKGDAEAAVRELPYPAIQIFRPSLLLGARAEFRLGERAAAAVAPVLSLLLPGRWRRFRPIQAADVARAMVHVARHAPAGANLFEYDAMRAGAV
jgi:uncharacterized protein YbjT (DUF2867 family)